MCNQVLYKNHDIDDKIEALAGLKTAQEVLEINNNEAVDVSYNTILGQVNVYYLSL